MNDDIKNIVSRCEESIHDIERGCVDTATGLMRKIDWVKGDMEPISLDTPKISINANIGFWRRFIAFFVRFFDK
jgi:hypothetical protein